MRFLAKYLWGFLLILSYPVVLEGMSADSLNIYRSSEMNSDPVTGKRYFGTLKVSTLQVLFSEVPFTLEIFMKNDLSIQMQAGIIFPLESDSFLEQFFRSGGSHSSASSNGIISYRNSPYNNHGLSFKLEIRKYLSDFYYAPQIMYKRCWYDEIDFPVYVENRIINQTESKNSGVFGAGIMFGRQTYFLKQATDWYVGAGLRARRTAAYVLRVVDKESPQNVVYPDTTEKSSIIYPFVNFGFRLGLVL